MDPVLSEFRREPVAVQCQIHGSYTLSLRIRLLSDSASRRTPLSSADSSCCQAYSELSPPNYDACRAHIKCTAKQNWFCGASEQLFCGIGKTETAFNAWKNSLQKIFSLFLLSYNAILKCPLYRAILKYPFSVGLRQAIRVQQSVPQNPRFVVRGKSEHMLNGRIAGSPSQLPEKPPVRRLQAGQRAPQY